MPKFTTKAAEVEARQWDGTAANAYELVAWIQAGKLVAYFDNSQYPDALYVVVNTRSGPAYASPKDWLVLWPSGVVRVCKPDEITAYFNPKA